MTSGVNGPAPWEPPAWIPPGKRVAYYRGLITAPPMSQYDLGVRVGRSQGWVSQVENCTIAVDRITVLDKLAEALGVSRHKLTGEPAEPRSAGDMDATISVQAIRSALLVPDEPTPPRDLVRLYDMADQAMRARMHVDHRSLGALLPALLADARTLCDASATRQEGLRLLVQGAVTGALAVKPLGYVDLALLLAERAETAARELEDPVYVAAAAFTMAQCVMAHGSANRQSLVIASRAVDNIATTGRGPAAAAWHTMLLLHSGLAAALIHEDELSNQYLNDAEGVVANVEGNPWRMEATEWNRRLWKLSASVSNGHPERADELARQVDPAGLKTPQRQARLYLDHATGLYLKDNPDYAGATVQLLEAERIAPEDIHRRAAVKEMIRGIVRQTRSRPNGKGLTYPPAGLHGLAERCGVGPDETS